MRACYLLADPAASSSPSGPTRRWPRRPTPSSASLRRNGTLGKRVTIWVVSYEDDSTCDRGKGGRPPGTAPSR